MRITRRRSKGQTCRKGAEAIGAKPLAILEEPDFPGRWLEVQGLDIHYRSLGQGPPIVLVHGSGYDWQEWQENLTFFARSFHVYAPDMPGFGLSESTGSPLTTSWSVSFLRDFMDSLGLQMTHIIGHSLGGVAALAFALSLPERVRKLVLVNSGGLGKLDRSARLRLFMIRKAERLVRRDRRRPTFQKSSKEDWIFTDRLGDLKPPTMIIWGGRDPYLPVSQALSAQCLIPNCELHVFPNSGHAPHREHSAKFNKLVHEFFTN